MPVFNARTPGAELFLEYGETNSGVYLRHVVQRGPRGGIMSLCGRRQRQNRNRWSEYPAWYVDHWYVNPNSTHAQHRRHRDVRGFLSRYIQCRECQTRLDECFASL